MQLDRQIVELSLMGKFNPAIHTSIWYKANGLLDGVQDISAIESNGNTRIKFQGVEISCEFGKWSAKTEFEDNVRPVIDLADNLFHELLPHTPVTGGKIGISHRVLDSDNEIAGRVRATISKTGIAPRFGGGAMQWQRTSDNPVLAGSSMFWLCGDESHFHASHEYEFDLASALTGSTGYKRVKELVDILDTVIGDSKQMTKDISLALGIQYD